MRKETFITTILMGSVQRVTIFIILKINSCLTMIPKKSLLLTYIPIRVKTILNKRKMSFHQIINMIQIFIWPVIISVSFTTFSVDSSEKYQIINTLLWILNCGVIICILPVFILDIWLYMYEMIGKYYYSWLNRYGEIESLICSIL